MHCTTMSRYGNVNTRFLHELATYVFQMVCSDWEVSVLCSVLLLINQLMESVYCVMDHVPKVQCEWAEPTHVS